jgi:GH24 family phage-related lysozyme (muramidase)
MLKKEQFDAPVSFTFNEGSGNLANSQLLRDINAEHCDGQTITDDFHRFNRAANNPNALLPRRDHEINLFNNSAYR